MTQLELDNDSEAIPQAMIDRLQQLGITLARPNTEASIQADTRTKPTEAEHNLAATFPTLNYRGSVLSASLKDGQLNIDWLQGKIAYRRSRSSMASEAVAKAVGLKSGQRPNVADLTAGLGRDAFMLASLGSSVTMIERSPVLTALLADALHRLQAASEPELSQRLNLVHASSIEWATQSGQQFDCCYLDPMYPHRRKSSLVKQDLRLLRDIVGSDDDSQQLFDAAMSSGSHRVVVKRPSYAECLSGQTKPSHTIESGATRFDVYLRFRR